MHGLNPVGVYCLSLLLNAGGRVITVDTVFDGGAI